MSYESHREIILRNQHVRGLHESHEAWGLCDCGFTKQLSSLGIEKLAIWTHSKLLSFILSKLRWNVQLCCFVLTCILITFDERRRSSHIKNIDSRRNEKCFTTQEKKMRRNSNQLTCPKVELSARKLFARKDADRMTCGWCGRTASILPPRTICLYYMVKDAPLGLIERVLLIERFFKGGAKSLFEVSTWDTIGLKLCFLFIYFRLPNMNTTGKVIIKFSSWIFFLCVVL